MYTVFNSRRLISSIERLDEADQRADGHAPAGGRRRPAPREARHARAMLEPHFESVFIRVHLWQIR